MVTQCHLNFLVFLGKKQSLRNVTGKIVYRELQTVIIMLHIQFFNSLDDLRAKAFAKHGHEPNPQPLHMSLRQAYANFMADHLVKPGRAGFFSEFVIIIIIFLFFYDLFSSRRTNVG